MHDYLKNRMALKLSAVPVEKKQGGLKKRSEKMTAEIKQYKPMAAEFLSRPGNQTCKIKSPVCTKKATCINHKKRRGKNLMNEKYFEPSCGPCNNYIESHSQWALDHGHLISVHKIERS
jgi:hypothetical protein